jgi:thiamine biosynthesis protein ThiI
VEIVVHYAEIGLKGRNRPRFENALRDNLARALSPLGAVRIRKLYGRFLVELPEGSDLEDVAPRIQRVFGVAYFSRASVCEPSIEAIEAAVDAFVDAREFTSFGVRARRVEKRFPLRSNQIATRLGSRVGERTGARVDLQNPDLWIEVHVLSSEAILLHEKIRGPGGMPVGTAGRAISLISGGIDSPVASYEMASRGLELSYAHFHSAPFTNSASQDKVRDLVARLAVHQGVATLHLIPFAEIQQVLVSEAPAEPRIVLYRRFMLRLAQAIAEREGARGLVTGDSLAQVSSQTLANLDTIGRATKLPILRPLIGMDKGEIVDRARAIGTYQTSIEPDEDCCSYLMPRSPATSTSPARMQEIEDQLDVKGLLQTTLDRVQEERIRPIS